MRHGLSRDTLKEVERVLALHPEVEAAILYGSRAKGNHRHGSDIDLALTGLDLSHTLMTRIAEDFDDGPLPYRFDLSVLDQIRHEPLLDHIRRVGVRLYQRGTIAKLATSESTKS